jgi:iron complex outermembrane receptor protein
MTRPLALSVSIAAALAPIVAAAQSQAEPMQQIVVIGTRSADDALVVPAAIDRIDAGEIARARPQLQLSESLQRVPGVVARDRQNQAQDLQISIRGFGARATFGVRGVRLYTDGIPASMPDGQGQVSHFALEAADHIEVLRGPFSALYGNASGGVIEIFSAPPPAHTEFAAGLLAAAHGVQRESVSLRGPWRDEGEAGYRLDAANLDSDGYRHHSEASRQSWQAQSRGELGADTSYQLIGNGIDLDAQDPQGLTRAELEGDRRASSPNALRFDARKTVEQSQLGGRIEHRFDDSQRLAFVAYGGARKTTQMLTVPVAAQSSPTSGGGAIDLDRDYRGADLRWSIDRTLFDQSLTFTAGIANEIADERRRGYENFIGDRLGVVGALRRDEDNRVESFDQYLQLGWQASPRWHFNAGVRRSDVEFASDDRHIAAGNPDDSGELDFEATSPVIGALLCVTPTLSVYANAGRGFETPTFAELAYRNDGASGLNDGLDAATSDNVEIGLRARSDRHRYSAALFESRTRDELVVASNQGGRSVFANAGLSRRRGFEFAVAGELGERFRYAANYTWLDARYRRDFSLCQGADCGADDRLIEAGRHIPGLARNFAWAELRWIATPDIDVLLEGRYVDRVFADDANSAFAPSYTSFDLGVEKRFRGAGLEWRSFARLDNLFDRDIIGSVIVNDANGRYFEPAPGRGWSVGISATKSFD